MQSFFVENFGCRATQADGAAIERDLLARGMVRAGARREADLVVLNTCTVTAAADQDARSAIRRARRENPQCKVLVTGCYAQRAPEQISAIPGVTWVVGNSHKSKLGEIAAGSGLVSLDAIQPRGPESHAATFVSDIFAHTELLAAPGIAGNSGWDRTRPTLKVQDGCDNRCSFCVIPYVRGQSRSLPLEAVLREVDALVSAGYREIVLSGINLGRWGRDLDPIAGGGRRRTPRFEDLLRAILERTAADKLRISSVEPMDWSSELIGLMADSPRIAKHAHVPLQSGSDRILRQMHRKYRPWHYADRIVRIREAMPAAAIGADVMVGFPGESEADFKESRRFIAELPFTYLHVFMYSPRPGTPAAAMPSQVHGEIARERSHALRQLAAEKNLAFRRSMVGCTLSAITLNTQPGGAGCTEALSDNYLKLRVEGDHAPNRWLEVRVTRVTDDGIAGTPLHGPGSAENVALEIPLASNDIRCANRP
ncbi:MAG TPA: tRNA (N(6)-L-threonylcarbamoyladenosine(37)-C(2))-methylthiotransferase MtaB [Terriglobales bacterium]|nr:tRNA (N(6)-L-threonylcarbamoyladenosine(37)-C(2))-methylthiotransferase MtaB [Terriglobales bacterium]